MKRSSLMMVVLFQMFVLVAGVEGLIPQWDVDFDGMDANEPPALADATAGVVNTQPTRIILNNVNNQILVVGSFTVGSSTLDSNPVVINHTVIGSGTVPELAFEGAAGDVVAGNNFALEFDLLIPSYGGSKQTVFAVYFYSSDMTQLGVFGLYDSAVDPGQGLIWTNSQPGQGPQTPAWLASVWDADGEKIMHMRVEMDAGNDVFVVWIDGAPVAAMALKAADSKQAVKEVRFSTASSTIMSMFGLDNIVSLEFVSPPVAGYPQWDVDFNSMTAGAPPAVAGAVWNQVNVKPTRYDTRALPNNTIRVESVFATNNESLADQPIVINHADTGTGSTPFLCFTASPADVIAGTNSKVEFDLLIPDYEGLLNSNGAPASLFNVDLYATDNTQLAVFGLDSSGRAVVWANEYLGQPPQHQRYFSGAWDAGAEKVMHVELIFDANDVFWAEIDGHMVASTSLYADATKQAVSEVRFNMGSNDVIKMYAIDNFVSSTWEGIYDCGHLWALGQGIAADFNQDCYVNVDDLALFSSQWLVSTEPEEPLPVGDLSGDHNVKMDDFGEFSGDWLECNDPADENCL